MLAAQKPKEATLSEQGDNIELSRINRRILTLANELALKRGVSLSRLFEFACEEYLKKHGFNI